MGQICISPYLSSYPIEKVGYFSYPYSVNERIFRQDVNGFGQYPRGWMYLSHLILTLQNIF